MKKTYQKPEIDICTSSFNLMQSLGVTSQTTGQNNYTYGDTKARSSYDEDEAFSATEGASSYGDLW